MQEKLRLAHKSDREEVKRRLLYPIPMNEEQDDATEIIPLAKRTKTDSSNDAEDEQDDKYEEDEENDVEEIEDEDDDDDQENEQDEDKDDEHDEDEVEDEENEQDEEDEENEQDKQDEETDRGRRKFFCVEYPENLQDLFQQLIEGADAVVKSAWDKRNDIVVRKARERYVQFFIESVTNHPTLAFMTIAGHECEDSSLLYTLLMKGFNDDKGAHPTIKLLIEKNPFSLLWKVNENYDHYLTLMHKIAFDRDQHMLMLWIAKEYTWALDRFQCDAWSPDAFFVNKFGDGKVTESVLRSFLEVYPRCLFPKKCDDFTPLQSVLSGTNQECSLEFFQWMVGQNSNALGLQIHNTRTTLYSAIIGWRKHRSRNMQEICRFIIEQCPELVQEKSIFEALESNNNWQFPYSYRKAEQDIVMMLLEVHSEPFDLVVEFHRPRDHFIGLRNNTFRQLKSLLDKRKDHDEDMSFLNQVSMNLIEASACSKNTLFQELPTVFDSWSRTLTQQIEQEVNEIQIGIHQIWTKYEEQHHALVVELNHV